MKCLLVLIRSARACAFCSIASGVSESSGRKVAVDAIIAGIASSLVHRCEGVDDGEVLVLSLKFGHGTCFYITRSSGGKHEGD
jgi:hypothetical protein